MLATYQVCFYVSACSLLEAIDIYILIYAAHDQRVYPFCRFAHTVNSLNIYDVLMFVIFVMVPKSRIHVSRVLVLVRTKSNIRNHKLNTSQKWPRIRKSRTFRVAEIRRFTVLEWVDLDPFDMCVVCAHAQWVSSSVRCKRAEIHVIALVYHVLGVPI